MLSTFKHCSLENMSAAVHQVLRDSGTKEAKQGTSWTYLAGYILGNLLF
jgi:hypothetical protein